MHSAFYLSVFDALKHYEESELVEHFQVLYQQVQEHLRSEMVIDITGQDLEIPPAVGQEILILLIPVQTIPRPTSSGSTASRS
jgi:hypothetical protein